MQDRYRRLDGILLRHTAGPYIRVRFGLTRNTDAIPVSCSERTSGKLIHFPLSFGIGVDVGKTQA